MHIMSVTPSIRNATVDSVRPFVSPPLGSVLTFTRDGKRQSFTWDSNVAGQALVRLYRFTGWTLVSGRAGT